MKHRKQKRSLTLLEIMIVIVLIGLIGSVIGVNMKGSLDEGKAFKTRQAKEQIQDLLMLEVAKGSPIDNVVSNPETYLSASGMVKEPKKFLKDGWGQPFEIKRNRDNITVTSDRLKAYDKKKKEKTGQSPDAQQDDDETEAAN